MLGFNEIRELQLDNERLRQELAATIAERDEWKNKAVEISHTLTYISEQSNHREIAQEYPGDGPFREMFK
jgi:lipopolysaccharide biosynthesis regulator YciM